MIETPLYTEIMNDFPKELVHKWEFIEITPECRLHYKLQDDNNGFYFHSVNWTGNTWNEEQEENNIPYLERKESTAETLLYGIAAFDGVRHLYFGTKESDNEGYFYYPDFDLYIKIMTEISKLEKKYCWDADKRECIK